jgi:hypothetical protein
MEPFTNWCKETVLFAMMVRARDLRKGIPDKHNLEGFIYAAEVYQNVI